MASRGVSTTTANAIANICSVNGTGPKGMVTQADTAMTAMVNPTNAMERVREEPATRIVISPICSLPFQCDTLELKRSF